MRRTICIVALAALALSRLGVSAETMCVAVGFDGYVVKIDVMRRRVVKLVGPIKVLDGCGRLVPDVDRGIIYALGGQSPLSVIDIETLQVAGSLEIPQDMEWDPTLHGGPPGSHLVFLGPDRPLLLFYDNTQSFDPAVVVDPASLRVIRRTGIVTKPFFDTDLEKLLAVYRGEIQVIDPDTFQVETTVKAPSPYTRWASIISSDDGRVWGTVFEGQSWRGLYIRYDVNTGEVLDTYRRTREGKYYFTPDMRYAFCREHRIERGPNNFAYKPTGNFYIEDLRTGTVATINLASVFPMESWYFGNLLRLSPDGKMAAVIVEGETEVGTWSSPPKPGAKVLAIFDLAEGKLRPPISLPSARISDVVFLAPRPIRSAEDATGTAGVAERMTVDSSHTGPGSSEALSAGPPGKVPEAHTTHGPRWPLFALGVVGGAVFGAAGAWLLLRRRSGG